MGVTTGRRFPFPFLYLCVAKTGKNQLNEEITPLLPTGIGERFSQNISNWESVEQTRGALELILYSEGVTWEKTGQNHSPILDHGTLYCQRRCSLFRGRELLGVRQFMEAGCGVEFAGVHSTWTSVVDPDPVGSETFSRIRVWNKSF